MVPWMAKLIEKEWNDILEILKLQSWLMQLGLHYMQVDLSAS